MSSGNSGRKQQGARDARTRQRGIPTDAELIERGRADSRRSRVELGLCPIEEVDP